MKCRIFISRYPPQPGGSQNYVHEIASLAHQAGVKVQVEASWCQGCRTFDAELPFKVARSRIWRLITRLSRTGFRPLVILSILLHFINSILRSLPGKYDFMICGSLLSTGMGALVRHFVKKTPFILIIYGEEIKWLMNSWKYRWLAKIIIKQSSRIIVISRFTQHYLLSNSSCDSKKVYLFPPGIRNEFMKKFSQEEARKRLQINRKPVLLSVGRPEPRKGTLKLIRAFSRFLKDFPGALLFIVGKGTDLEKCRQLAKELEIKNNIVFTGFVPDEDLQYYFAACDLFILPNQNLPHDVEGFGIVFLEASSQGKPVIGGKSGGVTDAVIDGETGWLIEDVSPENIARAVTRLLNDPEKMKIMGEKGRKRVLEEYHPEKRKQKLMEIFAKLE